MCHAVQHHTGDHPLLHRTNAFPANPPTAGSELLQRIQAALTERTAPQAFTFTPCVATAIHGCRSLTELGLSSRVAVGRVHLSHSIKEHAWISRHQRDIECILDSNCSISSPHEPFALISPRTISRKAPFADIARLQPGFFLTIHCEINDAALKKLYDGSTIDDINHVNARVDDPFAHPNYDPREHFDNSMIEESIALLEDRLAWNGDTRLHTVTTGAPAAIAIGLACHAIADFYSHSNYAPMALAYFKDPAKVVPIDKAIADTGFLGFLSSKWDNQSLWKDYEDYSTTDAFPLGPAFKRCLITGAYGADSWTPRLDIPHHNDFAVDQPDAAIVHAPNIIRRKHPFAFPGAWKPQFDLRRRLAIAHLQAAVKRAQDHDPTPFLGSGQTLPDTLKPPPWTLPNGSLASAVPYLVRSHDGRPAPIA